MIDVIPYLIIILVAALIMYFTSLIIRRSSIAKTQPDYGRREILKYSSLLVILSLAMIMYKLFLYKHITIVPGVKNMSTTISTREIMLTLPYPKSNRVLENVLLNRRSVREWRDAPIDFEDLSLVLWSSYGVVEEIDGWFRKTSPSAGATYPMEIYVVIGERGVVSREGFLEAGVYKYDPLRHSLRIIKRGDFRRDLYRASLEQEWVLKAPISIVLCAVYSRTTRRYGERGYRYVYMEAGHVAQNIYLITTALGLGTVAVGAFYDDEVAEVISSSHDEAPLYILPVGVPLEIITNDFKKLEVLYERLRSGR